jgi:hypothetical protein
MMLVDWLSLFSLGKQLQDILVPFFGLVSCSSLQRTKSPRQEYCTQAFFVGLI